MAKICILNCERQITYHIMWYFEFMILLSFVYLVDMEIYSRM